MCIVVGRSTEQTSSETHPSDLVTDLRTSTALDELWLAARPRIDRDELVEQYVTRDGATIEVKLTHHHDERNVTVTARYDLTGDLHAASLSRCTTGGLIAGDGERYSYVDGDLVDGVWFG